MWLCFNEHCRTTPGDTKVKRSLRNIAQYNPRLFGTTHVSPPHQLSQLSQDTGQKSPRVPLNIIGTVERGEMSARGLKIKILSQTLSDLIWLWWGVGESGLQGEKPFHFLSLLPWFSCPLCLQDVVCPQRLWWAENWLCFISSYTLGGGLLRTGSHSKTNGSKY